MSVKSLVFKLDAPLPPSIMWLLKEYRLMVNEAVRYGLNSRSTGKYSLITGVRKKFRAEHNVYAKYIPSACEYAGIMLKNYRRNVRNGCSRGIPYATRLFCKLEAPYYGLNIEKGTISVPINSPGKGHVGERIDIQLPMSHYARSLLCDEKISPRSITIGPTKVIIALRKDDVEPFKPGSAIALDTNERSLDGVYAHGKVMEPIKLDFSEVSIVQERHHERRKHLQKKKANDCRTKKRLTRREGRREHDRVENRLHAIANTVLAGAERTKSAIVLEDLNGLRSKHRGLKFNRRMSSWPRRRLHSIIEYKAAWRGIPLIKVNPKNTSRACPMCGKINKSRKSAWFVCECGWQCDRHMSASLNILQRAINSNESLARGVRFHPDALRHDAMKPLYDLATGARAKPNVVSDCAGGLCFDRHDQLRNTEPKLCDG